MRRINLFLVIGIAVTFVLHSVGGALKLFGGDAQSLKPVAVVCVVLICLHTLAGIYLTVKTCVSLHRSGRGYFRNNLMFWARRISGLTIIIPLIMHIMIFQGTGDEAYRLVYFNTGRLISQILLLVSLALHVMINVKPMLISTGVRNTKAFSGDIWFILSVLLLFLCAGFFVYYLRWAAV